MPFCHKCGYKLESDDKFCFECGTPVREPKVRQNSETEPSNVAEVPVNDVKLDIDEAVIEKSTETQSFSENKTVEEPHYNSDRVVSEVPAEPVKPEKQSRVNRYPLIISIVVIALILHVSLFVAIGMASGNREQSENNSGNTPGLERNAGDNNWFWKKTTPKPTVSPTPKPVVKVKTSKSELSDSTKWGHWVLEYPQISISNKNTDSLNTQIRSDFEKYKYNYKDSSSRPYNSKFTYYIDDDMISILVEITHKEEYRDYVVYNVSIKTGDLMSDTDVIKKFDLKEKDFFFLVKNTYTKFEAGISYASKQDKERCTKLNLERISFKYVKPYIDGKSNICFVGYVDHAGKLSPGNLCFNTKTAYCITDIK